jgi:hypothetical protein
MLLQQLLDMQQLVDRRQPGGLAVGHRDLVVDVAHDEHARRDGGEQAGQTQERSFLETLRRSSASSLKVMVQPWSTG